MFEDVQSQRNGLESPRSADRAAGPVSFWEVESEVQSCSFKPSKQDVNSKIEFVFLQRDTHAIADEQSAERACSETNGMQKMGTPHVRSSEGLASTCFPPKWNCSDASRERKQKQQWIQSP